MWEISGEKFQPKISDFERERKLRLKFDARIEIWEKQSATRHRLWFIEDSAAHTFSNATRTLPMCVVIAKELYIKSCTVMLEIVFSSPTCLQSKPSRKARCTGDMASPEGGIGMVTVTNGGHHYIRGVDGKLILGSDGKPAAGHTKTLSSWSCS